MPPFLEQIAILLLAAVIAVPIAQRLGLGSVLGFLLAGLAIGPWGLGLGPQVNEVWDIAEFGVVLLLFVIGIEMHPRRLWALRRMIFGLGGLQVILSAMVLAVPAALFLHMRPSAAVVAGLALALSSTAISVQLLAERRELRMHHGRAAFAILLFQDIAVVPILALLPLLSVGVGSINFMTALWQTAHIIALLSALVVGGHYLLRPVLRLVAASRVPEIFTATALLIVIGVAIIMSRAGISVALGTFVAGVLLADSEYRHELGVTIAPFKGLLLGLFFMVVGMSINIGLVLAQPVLLLALTVGLIVLKAAVLYVLGWRQRLSTPATRKLAATLPQSGEFAFVILSAAVGHGLLQQGQADLLVAAVILSMLLTPLLVNGVDRFNADHPETVPGPINDWSQVKEPPVVIAGFGRVGQIVARVLRTRKIGFVALDNSPERIDFVRKYGSKAFYGDPTRLDVLRSAGIGDARLFVLAIDSVDASLRCARLVRRHFPQLPIVARARNRQHAYALMELGISAIHRETFMTSMAMAGDALKELGVQEDDIAQTMRAFRTRDQERLFEHAATTDEAAQAARLGMAAVREVEQHFERDEREAAGKKQN
ncbi:MAG TPA: monovalent cation:proton antiporter-2 (CPA2) family protein [Salinisphaeraceae bacterium]|nr:monovalent cation:proton antiporter-2 (CPA2) family protein [Salinisphaeraceae bacterium]